jgi:hypothetical protein
MWQVFAQPQVAVGAEAPSLLAGLIADGDGNPMTPTHAVKKGKLAIMSRRC